MEFIELNDNQRRLFINSIQTFDAWRDASARYARYKGGMAWKTVSGRQYLYRILDRSGRAKSLGAKSPETEAIYNEFVSAKAGLAARVKSLENPERAITVDQMRATLAAEHKNIPRQMNTSRKPS